MAFTPVLGTIANLQTSLKRLYPDEFFGVMTNTNAKFYEMAKQAKNIEADGEGVFWPAYLGTPQNMAAVAEGGALPERDVRSEQQHRVRPIQMVNSFEISFLLAAVGSERGSFSKTEVKRNVWEATTDLTKHMNRLMAGSHGTGRLGQVNANNGGAVTFVVKDPYTTYPFRKGMRLDVYTADTGGAISSSGNATELKVTGINRSTKTLTVNTSVTVLANEHIYVTGDYGNAPNGLPGLVDDTTFLTTVQNLSRATYSELNCVADSNSGVNRPLTEEMLIDLDSKIVQEGGEHMDTILANSGIRRQYLRFVIPNRRYEVSGKGVPSYQTGFKDNDLQFFGSGGPIDFRFMEDVLPRTLYMIKKSLLRRFEVKPLGWYDHGGGAMLSQGVSSLGKLTTHDATLWIGTNIGYMKLNACGVIRDLLDPQLVGDAEQ